MRGPDILPCADTWVAEASKLGEMYAAVTRDAYKPVDKAVTKRASCIKTRRPKSLRVLLFALRKLDALALLLFFKRAQAMR